MTREQVKKVIPSATDEEITAMLNAHNTELTSAKSSQISAEDLMALRDKASKFDDFEKEKLSAEEKTRLALEEAEKSKSDATKILNRAKAVAELAKNGITEDACGGILDSFVTDNEETTLNNAKQLISMFSKQKETLETQFKEQNMSNTPKPPFGQTENNSNLSDGEQIAKSLAEKQAQSIKASAEALNQFKGG